MNIEELKSEIKKLESEIKTRENEYDMKIMISQVAQTSNLIGDTEKTYLDLEIETLKKGKMSVCSEIATKIGELTQDIKVAESIGTPKEESTRSNSELEKLRLLENSLKQQLEFYSANMNKLTYQGKVASLFGKQINKLEIEQELKRLNFEFMNPLTEKYQEVKQLYKELYGELYPEALPGDLIR